jgi:anti-sigma B factor antagonist
MKGQLALTVTPRPPGKAILRAEGSIDLATFKPFETAFRDFDAQGVRYVVVDMAGLTYMASSGFGLLIKAKTEYAKSGGDVVLVRPQTAIVNILTVLGLVDFFRIASSVEEALLPPAAGGTR